MARRGPPPEVTVVNRQRTERISTVRVQAVAEFVLERLGLAGAQVAVVLVGDPAIRRLNKRWRGVDRATDVLSFPQEEAPGGGLHPELLGDVVVSLATARRQAAENGCCFAAEVDRLIIHGLLHLAGYEHEGDPAAARLMRRRERAIARRWLA